MYICVCIGRTARLCMYVCMYICMYVCIDVCSYSCVYVSDVHHACLLLPNTTCVCMSVFVYVCVNICTDTPPTSVYASLTSPLRVSSSQCRCAVMRAASASTCLAPRRRLHKYYIRYVIYMYVCMHVCMHV